MPRKTPHKSQVKGGRPSLESVEYELNPGELVATQYLSGGINFVHLFAYSL